MNSTESAGSGKSDVGHGPVDEASHRGGPHRRGPHCGGPHGRRRLWKIPLIILAMLLVKSVVAMLLWNGLVPELFHGPTLTYLQALGLVLLAKALFGHGMRPYGGGWGGGGRNGPLWMRWQHLPPEERAKLRDELRRRHRHHHQPD